MELIDLIAQHQKAAVSGDGEVPEHTPEMLLIGCVDARKDPIDDLGIPKGKALILRNVAALVHPEHEKRLTESAALAFAVRHMKVKHIAVMGHTDCGGIRAAIEGISSYSLRDYLQPVYHLSEQVQQAEEGLAAQRRLLEQEAIKYSVRNLRSYDYIREAEEEGTLKLHGWLLDIASGGILVWDEAADGFTPMAK
jgi:carbonic anhydrase